MEARSGAIGTDRNDLLFGIPSTNIPQIPLVQPVPAAIPEIPIAKRKDQRGVAKLAVFAYHRATGTPVWQSGIVREESSANDVWIFGAGPFQRGTIYEGTTFAGGALKNEPTTGMPPSAKRSPSASVTKESVFTPPQNFVKQAPPATVPAVALAVHQEPVPPAKAAAGPPVAASAPATPVPAIATVTAVAQPTAPASAQPAVTQAIASTPAVPPSVATPTPAPTASPPPNSAFARSSEGSPLPQPRFNSPQ